MKNQYLYLFLMIMSGTAHGQFGGNGDYERRQQELEERQARLERQQQQRDREDAMDEAQRRSDESQRRNKEMLERAQERLDEKEARETMLENLPLDQDLQEVFRQQYINISSDARIHQQTKNKMFRMWRIKLGEIQEGRNAQK
jgi:hypothetical protein